MRISNENREREGENESEIEREKTSKSLVKYIVIYYEWIKIALQKNSNSIKKTAHNIKS